MNDILQLLASMSGQESLYIGGLTLLIFLGFLVCFIIRISDAMKDAVKNNGRINQYLAAVPAERIGTVNAVYRNTRLSLGSALLLSVVGGVLGIQNIYLGKRKKAILCFLFFWTGIPTILSLFDLSVMPRTVSEYNLAVVQSLYDQIAAPKIQE